MRYNYSKLLEASNQLHAVILDAVALRVSTVADSFLKSRVVNSVRPWSVLDLMHKHRLCLCCLVKFGYQSSSRWLPLLYIVEWGRYMFVNIDLEAAGYGIPVFQCQLKWAPRHFELKCVSTVWGQQWGQHFIQLVRGGGLNSKVKRPKCESDHLLPFNPEVKKNWCFTYTITAHDVSFFCRPRTPV